MPFPGNRSTAPRASPTPGVHPAAGAHDQRPGQPRLGLWTSGYGDSHPDAVTGYLVSTHPDLGLTGTGILGASYTAAAGLYKNLGYGPNGYDMIDNDGNGLVDDWAEGDHRPATASQIAANLSAHTHNTARAEMLYAILVEGRAARLGLQPRRLHRQGGQDTDGDGLPEFVDAWGQPLQFFRWPLLYHSDIQRGQAFFSTIRHGDTGTSLCHTDPARADRWTSASRTRSIPTSSSWRQDGGRPPAREGSRPILPPTPIAATPAILVRPASARRPSSSGPSSTGSPSPSFASVPLSACTGGLGPVGLARRAFFTKFLVLSGGPDRVPGVFLYTDADLEPRLPPPTASRRI